MNIRPIPTLGKNSVSLLTVIPIKKVPQMVRADYLE